MKRKPRRERSERGVAVESLTRSKAEGYAQNIKNNIENTRTFALPHDQNSYTFTMNWEYDSWNRIQNITYPDGEKVHYSYDRGGNLKSMRGEKLNEEFHYIQSIDYNTFGARTDIAYGNGTSAHYEYDLMQRLASLVSVSASGNMQNLVYEYDNVSNITQVTNSAAPVNGLGGQYMNGHYYDNLYRLIYSESYWNNGYGYVFAANYARDGKITHKETYANGNTGQTSSYNFYTYNKREQPHTLRTISDGQQFKWNVNGNLIEHSNSKAFDLRRLCWDQENRLSGVADDKYASIYYYDAAGERTVKITGANEWIDVNGTPQGFAYLNDLTLYTSPYLVANAKGYTKHYYIEGQRVTSKLGGGGLEDIHEPVVSVTEWKEKHRVIGKSVTSITKCLGITKFEYSDPLPGYCEVSGRLPLLCKYYEVIHPETDLYFYHPDHLGSSSWITDKDGNPIQHLAYMPFGEEFVDQQTSDWSTAYKFSGKEKDLETGYNYFHARYYSPDISIFISVDPMSDKYPSLSSYNYCNNNPIKNIDPDGQDWYENENGVVTWTNYTNKKEFANSGIKGTYLGKTHKDTKGNYYSLFGQTMKGDSHKGKITQKIDDAFIKYSKYLEASNDGGYSANPFNAEWDEPIQASTDFSGIIPFNNSWGTTSENRHGPDEMGRYAGMADIYFMVTGSKMSGKFESFSEGMKEGRITGNNGSFSITGNLLTIRNTVGNPIVTLRFSSKANVESFRNKFFNLFPNAKSK